MKARIDLSLAAVTPGTERIYQTRRSEEVGNAWEKRISRQEKRSAVKLGLQAAKRNSVEQEERAARVELLRAQVQAGTYEVDTRLLAENILFPHEDMRRESPGT